MPNQFSANPYSSILPIDDPALFFGRNRELRRFYSALVNRQCISLIGLRQIGKTSVLQYLMYTRFTDVKQRFNCDLSRSIFIFLDLREYLHKNAQAFFNAISEQIFKQCHDYIQVTIQPDGGEDEFSHLLDQIKQKGYHTVLLMDAFDNVVLNKEFDLEFFAFLRAQASMKKVSYITSSVSRLDEISHSDIKSSPFFNIFTTYRLEALTLEEAEELIFIPSSQTEFPFNRDEAGWLLNLAGRHPFFLSRTCYFLLEAKSSGTTSDLDKVEREIYQQLQSYFEWDWNDLSVVQQEALKEDARFPGKYQGALPELGESALFRKFVLKKYSMQVIEITFKDVEDALSKLEDSLFLGESNLQYLRIVSRQLVKEDASTTRRGLAVRQALTQAFENLRGNGVRSDGASDWRRYNILHYRYFKLHLANEQVAARLGYNGTRQYFRDRIRAIETLLHVLLEMEGSSS